MFTLTAMLLGTTALAEPAPTPAQSAIYEALRLRHDPPSCTALAGLADDPVADLSWIVDNAIQPPWVGLRAAQCLLVEHPVASQSQFEGWLSTEGHRGLAIMVTQRIDEIPLPVATTLAMVALAGPEEATVRPRLLDCNTPEVRALATR